MSGRSVMPLIFVIPGFTEPRCKGRLFSRRVKVGNIPKCADAEARDALSSFLCINGGDGGWRCAQAVPQRHRGNVHQVA